MAIHSTQRFSTAVHKKKKVLMEEAQKGPGKKESHIAIAGFHGDVQVVAAAQLKVCVPTKECIQFWFHMLAAVFACLAGIALMCVFRTTGLNDPPVFQAGVAMLALGVGVLIPSPSYGSILPASP